MRSRLCATVAVLALAAVSAADGRVALRAAKKPVALMHVRTRAGCATASRCTVLPPWMRSLRNPMDVVLFADGSIYYRGRVIAVGRPGAGPPRCDRTLFSRPFSGTCKVSDFGIGYVAKTSIPGPYRGPDLWVVSESALIGSSPAQMVNPFPPYPMDTATPARPGHYTIGQLVGAPGSGETLTIDVTKEALG
jgi:hypothetical protein